MTYGHYFVFSVCLINSDFFFFLHVYKAFKINRHCSEGLEPHHCKTNSIELECFVVPNARHLANAQRQMLEIKVTEVVKADYKACIVEL